MLSPAGHVTRSHRSKLQKEISGLLPCNYSYGRRVPVENKSCCRLTTTNISCAPCAGTTDTATSTDSTPVIVNMENIQIGPIDNGEESSVGDLFSLSSDDTTVIAEEIVQEDRNHTYSSLNELGAKIVSFPQLKERIESNFVCKKCLIEKGLLGLSASSLEVKQKTYGIAMVFDITCKNGHDVQIIPELIDETQEKYSTNNFMLNYKLLLLMQLLGKGLKSIAIVTALLGMQIGIGNDAIWKKCSINLEKFKQNLQRIVVRKIYKRKSMQRLLRVTMKHVVIELALSVVVMLGGRGVDLETHITVFLATCYLMVAS